MTAEERAEYTAKLADARQAYHKLMTGTATRIVVDGMDGSRVEFTTINRAALYQYIQDLERLLAPAEATGATALRPMGFFF